MRKATSMAIEMTFGTTSASPTAVVAVPVNVGLRTTRNGPS